MSEMYEIYLAACAKADERDEILGHIAGIVTLVAIVNLILGVIAVLSKNISFFNVVHIISWVVVGANLLRILISGITTTSLVSGIVKMLITIALFVTVMLVLALIPACTEFLRDLFNASEEIFTKAKWYFAISVSSYVTLIMARIF